MRISLTSALLLVFHISILRACDDNETSKKPTNAAHKEPVVSSYYPGYAANMLEPDAIPWKQFNHMDYFVAVPQNAPDLPLVLDDEDNMKTVVAGAKKNKVSISISVGGWTGSRFFSTNVGNAQNRTIFVKTLSDFVHKYGFDGIDIDWEYPNRQGMGCNLIKDTDSSNLLEFLKLLRTKLGPSFRLSAAVPVQGFNGPDGEPLQDHSAFGKVLDYITVMAYDIYGPGWAKFSGPNAPLYDTCNDPTNKYSGKAAVSTWTSTGFPASKILLGVPSYGYGYTTLASNLKSTQFSGEGSGSSMYYQQVSSVIPPGGATSGGDDTGKTDACGNAMGNGGNWLFRELIETKKLSEDTRKGLNGYTRHYDSCSRTPFIFHSGTRNLISYDDPVSLGKKAVFAKVHGLGGINVFDTTGDTKDNILLKSINSVLRNTSTTWRE
ncbi:family 18 glycoside hydrolase [Melampsora americana]|nr:family 18 glycoside hydrolase [Melampsora americana]